MGTYIGVNTFRTVVFVCIIARPAAHATSDLRPYTDAISNLDVVHVLSNMYGFADNLMSDDQGEVTFAPSLLERMKVRAADTAMGDSYLDVIGPEGLGLEARHLQVKKVRRIY